MTTPSPTHRMQRARDAQALWAQRTVAARCKSMRKLRSLIASRIDQIVQVICQDTGKPSLDALAGDILPPLEQLRFYERRAPRLLRNRRIGKPAFFYTGCRFYQCYEPHGVVLIYAPYNYPFQLAVIPLITALFAGNAVLLKCSEKTPLVAALIAELCAQAGLPQHLVQVVDDPPEQAAAYLDAHPDFVFFTGSTQAGRRIASRAAQLVIPCVLELGGKDAALVFSDCNLKRTVEGVAYGAFSNAGQVCVGIKRLYIHESLHDIFLERLVDRVRTLRVGSGADCDLSFFPHGAARDRLVAQVQDAIAHGAIVHWPKQGEITAESPVILGSVPRDARLLQEETFGPVLCVDPFRNESEALQLANSGPCALGSSVWTSDPERAHRIAAKLQAGACAVNDVIRNIANPYASFGGNRSSGYGRYHGPQGLFTFSRIKSVMLAEDRGKQETHWFPFRQATFRSLQKLLAFRHSASVPFARLRNLLLPALLCMVLCSIAAAQPASQAHLRIVVTPPHHSHGQIAFLVFASPQGFPKDTSKAVKSGFAPLPEAGSPLTIDAGTFPPGRYAVTVYQDVNGNRKLDFGLLGIPREPLGASNNPRPRMGPPRFDECAFPIGRTDKTISILMVH